MSGMIIGTIVSVIIFAILLFNIDNYINFMNMDIDTYKVFTIYSVLQLFICLEFAMVLNKLYYEEKNTLANKYSLIFNLLNFILLSGTSLITKNQIAIITTTLIPLSLFTLYIYIKKRRKLMKRVTNTTLFIIIVCCLSIIGYKFYNYFVDKKL